MSRRITTISLDDESHERAKKIGNLSAFVRDALLHEARKTSNQPVDYHNAMHSATGVCHPFKAQDGYCSICWPYGQPTKSEYDWWIRDWYQSPAHNKPKPPRQLPDRRENPHANAISEQESSKAVSQKVGIIRQVWRFFF